MTNIPIPKNEVPMIGTIQCVFSCADQPYINSAAGMKSVPGIAGGRRYSGFFAPPCLRDR